MVNVNENFGHNYITLLNGFKNAKNAKFSLTFTINLANEKQKKLNLIRYKR
jgi:hypothetical protein